MPAAAAALSKEEQELFEQMQKDDGKPAIEAKAEKPKEEVKTDAKSEEKKEESKVVPLQALHEAREQNKELRKEMEAMKAALSDGDKKMQALLAKIENKADAGPNFEDNPAAHLKHENAELKKGLAELQEKMSQKDRSEQQDGKMREHAVLVSTKEQAFAKQHADYFQASEHVATLWREEFSEAGFEEAEIPKLVFAKALGITNKAVQAGRDPAEAIYKIAKKYGFAAKAPEKKVESGGEAKLKQIEKGLEAAKGAGGGAGPDEDSGLAGLAELDDEQLEKRVADKDWWNKNIRRSPL